VLRVIANERRWFGKPMLDENSVAGQKPGAARQMCQMLFGRANLAALKLPGAQVNQVFRVARFPISVLLVKKTI
jgi:hypothetical protein